MSTTKSITFTMHGELQLDENDIYILQYRDLNCNHIQTVQHSSWHWFYLNIAVFYTSKSEIIFSSNKFYIKSPALEMKTLTAMSMMIFIFTYNMILHWAKILEKLRIYWIHIYCTIFTHVSTITMGTVSFFSHDMSLF